jgi:hypothetical protein
MPTMGVGVSSTTLIGPDGRVLTGGWFGSVVKVMMPSTASVPASVGAGTSGRAASDTAFTSVVRPLSCGRRFTTVGPEAPAATVKLSWRASRRTARHAVRMTSWSRRVLTTPASQDS